MAGIGPDVSVILSGGFWCWQMQLYKITAKPARMRLNSNGTV
jgi:hypothetical protein